MLSAKRNSKSVLPQVLAAAVLAAATLQVSAAASGKPPLVLDDQGSFYVGGEIVFSEYNYGANNSTSFGPGDISINHAYVQYQVPLATRYRYPIIMVHGGGHTGKTYETTPDGREGWFTSFARRGFAAFVMDDPNRGRACCEPTQIHRVRRGFAEAETLPLTSIYSKQVAWTGFRFGPAYPDPHPGVLFPLDAIDQYAAQWVFTYRDPEEIDKITAGIVAAIDHVGPCILMTHSQSGTPGRRAAVQRPDLVKAIIAVEGGGAFPQGSPEEAIQATIPLLQVEGDFTTDQARANRKAITERLVALGGTAETIVLPEIGIHGNTHMMMMDTNNEQVADVIEEWIKTHVPDVRGRYRYSPP